MPYEKEKWQKFRDGEYQFKVPIMLYADLENTIKAVDKQYREKKNNIKSERKDKAPYTEKMQK